MSQTQLEGTSLGAGLIVGLALGIVGLDERRVGIEAEPLRLASLPNLLDKGLSRERERVGERLAGCRDAVLGGEPVEESVDPLGGFGRQGFQALDRSLDLGAGARRRGRVGQGLDCVAVPAEHVVFAVLEGAPGHPPREGCVEQSDQPGIVSGEEVGGVVEVGGGTVARQLGLPGDVGEDDFWAGEKFVVAAGSQFPPVLPLVAALDEFGASLFAGLSVLT